MAIGPQYLIFLYKKLCSDALALFAFKASRIFFENLGVIL